MDEVRLIQAGGKTSVESPSSAIGRTMPAQDKSNAKPEPATDVEVKNAVQDLNDFAVKNDIHVTFSVHEATGRTVIKVVDADTHEVVRQLPPEELLDLQATLEEMNGLLLEAIA